MYYAYSISLMNFLRLQLRLNDNIKNNAEDIFIKLGLDDTQKKSLHDLLIASKNRSFTSKEIKCLIEPILGPATRRLGAEHTREEFLKNPTSSPIFASANYGIEYACKKSFINNKNAELAALIDNDFNNKEFKAAEIYRVAGINSLMEMFVKNEREAVEKEFHDQWEAKQADLVDKPQENVIFHQTQLLNEIIRKKTIEFFTIEGNANLDLYANHLNTDTVWGTEETLMVLHRALTGEKVVRDPQTGNVTSLAYDTEIQLNVFKNGVPTNTAPNTPFLDKVGIILNNQGNAHWTSLIPVEPGEALSESRLRENALSMVGFDDALELIKPLCSKDDDVKIMHDALLTIKKTFVESKEVRLAAVWAFVNDCRAIISHFPAAKLQDHTTLNKVFNVLLNALIALITGFTLNLFFGTFHLVKPSETEPKKSTHLLAASLGKFISSQPKQAEARDKPETDDPTPGPSV